MKGLTVLTKRSDLSTSQSPPQWFAQHVNAPLTNFACEGPTCKKRLEHSILKQPATYVKQPVRSRTLSLREQPRHGGWPGRGSVLPAKERHPPSISFQCPRAFQCKARGASEGCSRRRRESILCPSQCTTPS